MASKLLQVADAVVSELNAGMFSVAFTAVRQLVPGHELTELATLRVTVAPRSRELVNASRGATQADYVVDVGVQKHLATDELADGLIALAEEIADYLTRRVLAATPWAGYVRTRMEPSLVPDQLRELQVVSCAVAVVYRAIEEDEP